MIVKGTVLTITLKFALDLALFASVTVAVMPYVPGFKDEAAVTTPVLESMLMPET